MLIFSKFIIYEYDTTNYFIFEGSYFPIIFFNVSLDPYFYFFFQKNLKIVVYYMMSGTTPTLVCSQKMEYYSKKTYKVL